MNEGQDTVKTQVCGEPPELRVPSDQELLELVVAHPLIALLEIALAVWPGLTDEGARVPRCWGVEERPSALQYLKLRMRDLQIYQVVRLGPQRRSLAGEAGLTYFALVPARGPVRAGARPGEVPILSGGR